MPNCFGLIFVMWCSVQAPPPAQSTLSYCSGYKKMILLSRKDTRETKEQVDERNRIFKAMCGDNGK